MTPAPFQYFIGVDLGKLRDFTAITVVERFSYRVGWDAVNFCDVYHWKNVLRWAERVRLGTRYPKVIERIGELVKKLALKGPVTVIVDATGVGQPVVDALQAVRLPCELVAVTITGGEQSTRSRGGWNVPKTELIVSLQMMIATNELVIPGDLRLRGVLSAELASMPRSLRAGGSGHDDLVLSLALAAWRLRTRKSIGERWGRLV